MNSTGFKTRDYTSSDIICQVPSVNIGTANHVYDERVDVVALPYRKKVLRACNRGTNVNRRVHFVTLESIFVRKPSQTKKRTAL